MFPSGTKRIAGIRQIPCKELFKTALSDGQRKQGRRHDIFRIRHLFFQGRADHARRLSGGLRSIFGLDAQARQELVELVERRVVDGELAFAFLGAGVELHAQT